MEHSPNFGPDYDSLAEDSPETIDDDVETKPTKKSKSDSKEKNKSPDGLFEKKPRKASTPEARIEAFENKAEKEPPIDNLANDEKRLVAQEYVDDRIDQVRQELETPQLDDAIEAAALANAAFIENVQNRLEDGELASPEVLDAALADAANELGIIEEDPIDLGIAPEAEPGDEIDDPIMAVSPAGTPPGVVGGGIPVAPVVLGAPMAGPPSPPMGVGGGGGGGVRPPLPPAPAGGGMPPTPPVGMGTPMAFNRAPNVLPNFPEQSHSHIQYVLAGGIVGYLLGRRRGRIKTEKRLLPVQEKLQKEVGELQQGIAAREQKIRALAQERVATKPTFKQELISKLAQRKEVPVEAKVEADNKQQKPEKLGGLILQSELSREKVDKKVELTAKAAESMNTTQLLAIAAGIELAGTNVKKLFEMRQLNEVGLQKVVLAFVRGERYDTVLQEELRSPNKPSVGLESTSATSNSKELNGIVDNSRNNKPTEMPDRSTSPYQQDYSNANVSQINQIVNTVNGGYPDIYSSDSKGKSKSLFSVVVILVVCTIAVLVWAIVR